MIAHNQKYLNADVLRDLKQVAQLALAEDIADGDISANLLADNNASATIITRQQGIYCGELWIQALNETLAAQTTNHNLSIEQHKKDGEICQQNETLISLEGNLRQLLNLERTLLNGLQLLCGVATKTQQFVKAVEDYGCYILDTRKTIPGWRKAQKYAVRTGGGKNHRMGLYDAYLLKENHQLSTQKILDLIALAKREQKKFPICVEVESIPELQHILPTRVQQILLDNFSISELTEAVKIKHNENSPCLLEASGNIDLHNIQEIAQTGVDAVSIGSLTKNITAMDLSMRLCSNNL